MLASKCVRLLFVALFLAFFAASAEEAKVVIHFPDTELEVILDYYSRLAKRKVWVAVGVHANVSIETTEGVSITEALGLIRRILLEKHGIALRDNEVGETFVFWSDKPK